MVLSIPGRVVVFDYGEVISYSPSESDRAALLELAGIDGEQFWPRYWHTRDDLDRGTVSTHRYWRSISADLGVGWSEARIQQLWVADYRSWLSVNPDVFDLISELHAGGTRIALLSNAGFDFASYFRFGPLGRFFEKVLVSAELNQLKPEPEIFLTAAQLLGITPAEMVFIDNKQSNVDGAASVGITAHLFVSAGTLRGFLTDLHTEPGRS